ncbi:MAG: recombination protein NinG [Candidatus Pacebacteria bacterium]|nr:recombination protein NinG [Candidatus Paceibacterota bacterium]
MPKPSPKKKTSAQLKKELWKIFSIYIRTKDAVGDENVCFTCGVRKPWKMLHAGHYIRASAGLATYFLEKNVHPQCYACNIWRDGNSDEYALALQRKYGEDILNELNREKQKIVKDFPFQSKISHYQELLEKMKS